MVLSFTDKELTALVLCSSNYTHAGSREHDKAQASAARKLGQERRRRKSWADQKVRIKQAIKK